MNKRDHIEIINAQEALDATNKRINSISIEEELKKINSLILEAIERGYFKVLASKIAIGDLKTKKILQYLGKLGYNCEEQLDPHTVS